MLTVWGNFGVVGVFVFSFPKAYYTKKPGRDGPKSLRFQELTSKAKVSCTQSFFPQPPIKITSEGRPHRRHRGAFDLFFLLKVQRLGFREWRQATRLSCLHNRLSFVCKPELSQSRHMLSGPPRKSYTCGRAQQR